MRISRFWKSLTAITVATVVLSSPLVADQSQSAANAKPGDLTAAIGSASLRAGKAVAELAAKSRTLSDKRVKGFRLGSCQPVTEHVPGTPVRTQPLLSFCRP